MIASIKLATILLTCATVGGLDVRPVPTPPTIGGQSRRNFVAKGLSAVTMQVFFPKEPAMAAKDCFQDCYSNCRKIVPNDKSNYCTDNCRDYCAQEDRQDGLSGSISSQSGEVGILGGTFGTGTVVKGEDKPPSISLPGLNFDNKEGRQLLGY
uniref:Uncharacterized protein n=1 Tax=Entomoneis paludosa TaxID=265537 RepID=A0A7S2YJ77_9STRA